MEPPGRRLEITQPNERDLVCFALLGSEGR